MIYIDSSVIISILFSEEVHSGLWANYQQATYALSSHLLEAEVYSAAVREGRTFESAQETMQRITFANIDRSLDEELQKVFSAGYSKGADALHLATALYLDPTAKNLLFLTADSNQKFIAQKLGFRVE